MMQRCAEMERKAAHNEAADLILCDMINRGEAVMDANGNVKVV